MLLALIFLLASPADFPQTQPKAEVAEIEEEEEDLDIIIIDEEEE
ncbi:MAG TPA: hypothetical protein VLG76_00300 [Rhabdochlamydiaceae bacterium]|nr:hypothetical protein [Rhabdochlamydiaceae bacterium]